MLRRKEGGSGSANLIIAPKQQNSARQSGKPRRQLYNKTPAIIVFVDESLVAAFI